MSPGAAAGEGGHAKAVTYCGGSFDFEAIEETRLTRTETEIVVPQLKWLTL